MIYCAGESESFSFAKPLGIGMIDVAMNLTQVCMEKPPAFIFFVGTAGSYGEKKIFDIIESKTGTNIENSFFGGGSYTPINNMISTAEDVSRETMVNSSNYITIDEECSKHYLAQNIHLENMEFFAVLKVAEKFSIPAAGIFIVTNYCDNDAHETFKKNHEEAMTRLTEYMNKKVEN